ncbi:hypothetical protein HK096_005425, partial [Nowakowskiella sp. JEL0078]
KLRYSKTPDNTGLTSSDIETIHGVTVLRPLKGIDENLFENLESSFLQCYPHSKFEIIFSVASEDDPAIKIVKDLSKLYPEVDAKLIIGEKIVGINPKINNLIQGFEQSKFEIIWILDSNVRVEPGCLQRSVKNLQLPGTGLVHHLPTIKGFNTFGSQLEWMYMNAVHARMYTGFNWLEIDSCIIGKSTVFRKSDIYKAAKYCISRRDWPKKHLDFMKGKDSECGLEYFGQFMCEDNYIGRAIFRMGMKHRMPRDLVVQHVGKSMTIKDYLQRRMRWTRIRTFSDPIFNSVEPFTESVFNGLVASWGFYWFFGFNPFHFLVLHFFIWLSADILNADTLDPSMKGVFPLSAWIFRELSAFPLYMWYYFGNTIDWRGTVYQFNKDGSGHKSHPVKIKMLLKVSLQKFLAIFALVNVAFSQGWQRRLYYDALGCTDGHLTNLILTYDPRIPCPSPGGSDPTTWPCEQKSKVNGSLSAESTTCDTVTSSTFTDKPWFPNVQFVAGAKYFSVVAYTSTVASQSNCELTNSTALSVSTYVADGKCYAFEAGYYFKSTCTEAGGQVTMCSDTSCSSCSTPQNVSNTCSNGSNGLPTL